MTLHGALRAIEMTQRAVHGNATNEGRDNGEDQHKLLSNGEQGLDGLVCTTAVLVVIVIAGCDLVIQPLVHVGTLISIAIIDIVNQLGNLATDFCSITLKPLKKYGLPSL